MRFLWNEVGKMKKKGLALATAALLLLNTVGCGTATADSSLPEETSAVTATTETQETTVLHVPEITQIRSICDLATVECYYHNVAKGEKEKGTGVTHWGEKDISFWIEYTGVAKIGIDMSKVTMSQENGEYVITIPAAEILDINIVPGSWTENSYVQSADSWNKNGITAEDQTKAVNEAQETMKATICDDSSLLLSAQERAKELIKNYIDQLEQIDNTTFHVSYQYSDNVPIESDADKTEELTTAPDEEDS